MKSLDDWLLHWSNRLIEWGWRKHEIKKIEWLRYAMLPWVLGICGGAMDQKGIVSLIWSAFIIFVLCLLQLFAEAEAKMTASSHNAKKAMFRGFTAPLITRIWFLFAVCLNAGSAIMDAAAHNMKFGEPIATIGSIFAAFWMYVDYSFMPEGPSQRKKKEKTVWSTLLTPVPVRSR